MKRLPLVVVLALSAACKPAPPAGAKGDVYYKNLNCQACHQIGAEGSPHGGPDLTMVGLRKSPEWLDAFLKDPQAWRKGSRMPNPRLSDAARAKLVEYLSSLKGDAWGTRRPWEAAGLKGAEKGRVLYAKAGCVSCHGAGGAGGYPNNNVAGKAVPGLTGLRERFTKAEARAKIVKGVVPVKDDPAGPDPLLRMPAWGTALSGEELDAVVEYLWTLEDAGSAGEAW